MASKTAILAVKIVSDAKDFTKKMDGASKKVDSFSQSVKKMAVPAAAILAGLGAIAVGAGKMASDSEQNFGAVDAVFKEHAKAVQEMAKKSADSLGLSGSDYAKYSALLGSQLKNAGVPLDKLGTETNKLIGYGADFSAQFGGTVPEAVGAMSSALKGEFDPIEKYGISLNETRIKAQMAAEGTSELTGAAYDQAKAQAIMNLIQTQGADSMGAFGREAGTAAGQQAIATAKWQDASVALGNVLLPIMTKAAEVMAGVAKWVSENTGLVQFLAVALGILAGAIVALNIVMAIMNAIALVNPFVFLALAVAALIALIIYVATQTTIFQDIWTNVSKVAGAVWNNFVRIITAAWNGFMGFIRGALNNIGNFFNSVFSGIGNFVGSVLRNIGNFFSSVFNGARGIVQGVIGGIISTFNWLMSVVGGILHWLWNSFANVFNGVSGIVTGVINGIVGAFNNVSNAVSNAISWVRSLFNGFSLPGWLRDVMSFMGVGGTGFEMAGVFAMADGEMGIGSTGGMSLGSVFGGSSGKTEVHNYHITVNGALDANAVARQLKTIINSDALRNGSISAGSSVW